MSSYTEQLYITPADDDMKSWILTKEFTYVIGDVDGDERVVVPTGYQTDFATIPRIFWAVLPPTGRYGKATVVHDYLCTNKTVLTKDGSRTITRKEGDSIFFEAMGVSGVNPVVKYIMWSMVRMYAIITNKK